MTKQNVPSLRTPGVLAERLGVPLHRIQYLLRARNIEPTARAGRLRLYDRYALEMLRRELAAIDARRLDVEVEQ